MKSKLTISSPSVLIVPLSWLLLSSTERLNHLARNNSRCLLNKKDKNNRFLTLFLDGGALIEQRSLKAV